MTLEELAVRCEQASGADPELDARIYLAIHQPDYRYPRMVLNRKPASYHEAASRFCWDGGGGHKPWPAYSASIDAAMTLIQGPSEYPDSKTFLIDAATQTSVHPIAAYVWNEAGKHMGRGRTPVLALCAAALRARAASEVEG